MAPPVLRFRFDIDSVTDACRVLETHRAIRSGVNGSTSPSVCPTGRYDFAMRLTRRSLFAEPAVIPERFARYEPL